MNNPSSGVSQALAQGLRLSSDEAFEREKAKEASKAAYRRSYWQGYAKRVKRVFGTLSPEDFRAVKERAEAAGRSIWGQIWAESQAYFNQATLLSPKTEERQKQLLVELRRIGNNLNQLAKQGHVEQQELGRLVGSDNDPLGAAAAERMEELERLIVSFSVQLSPEPRSSDNQ